MNSVALANAFERLFEKQRGTLGSATSPRPSQHALHFKKTAYNWLNFCRELPPCYDANGKLISQTQSGCVYFDDPKLCQLAMLLANGKIMLIFWFALGDDFQITRRIFSILPVNLKELPTERIAQILNIFPRLETAMTESIQFKKNAGKNTGNYNLAKCRNVTDLSDKLFCESLGIIDIWEDIELYYVQTVRTDFHS